ncbi:MAG: hypothetical protein ACM37Z_20370, partial [Deltaproteobacteria bacterium]
DYMTVGFNSGLDLSSGSATQARLTFGIIDPRPMRRVLDPDFSRPNSFSLAWQYLRRGPNGLLAENANLDLDITPTPAYCLTHSSDNSPNFDPRCTGFKKEVVGLISGNLIYHLHDQVMAFVAADYDVRDHRFPGYHTAIKFLSGCECWTLTLAWKHEINPAKNSFNFNFSLLGLGAQKNTLK